MKRPAIDDSKLFVRPAESPVSRLVARLDGLDTLRDVYGADAMQEITDEVDRRIAGLAKEGHRLRRANDGVYAMAADVACETELERLAARLQGAIGDAEIATSAGPAVATLSVGAVSGAGMRPLAVLREAGAAAVEASRMAPAGRRCARVGQGGRPAAIAAARTALAALRERRLALAYQPILRADGTRLIAFNECLARILEPSGGVVAAAEFVPALEALRMTRLIDREVLSLALAELEATPTLRLSVNLSAQSLGDPGWLRLLDAADRRQPGVGARLIVEITESAVIHDEQRAQAFVGAVRRHGCAVALDDFGAGFSAFRHLSLLRPDILKIDGAFVDGIAGDHDSRTFVESMLVVARHFEMMTVAERVNEPGDAAALRDLGVDAFQGLAYGQPTIEPDWRRPWSDRKAI